ncbi:hypothetical protein [Archangium lansingense]|uniref:Lipoprotein n=1 Tax=Archangium lansingense TaxID=2995310 RepID=A0ABT4A7S0_9BACT|nr:hypothetical protein [Archangium lansinium]MCY1077376.1 hypothetical protein [Archangium lansinium]
MSLALILVSCGTTRYPLAGPAGSEDLARYALIIKPRADGQMLHEWVPLESFDVAEFQLTNSPNFQAIEPAINWLKQHRTELLVGTVIVIAGVAFTVVAVGSAGGALVLTPLVMFAEVRR